jgi:hypothetical protein
VSSIFNCFAPLWNRRLKLFLSLNDRHSQINDALFRAFDEFQERVLSFAHDNRRASNAAVEGLGDIDFEDDFDHMNFANMDELYEIDPLPLGSSQPAENPPDVLIGGAMGRFSVRPSFSLPMPDDPSEEFHDLYEPIGLTALDFDFPSVFEQKQSNGPSCTSCRPINEV